MMESRHEMNVVEASRSARERGLVAIREFERVVNSFIRVLEVKEKTREKLDKSYKELDQNINEISGNLKTLNRNIEIYEKNGQKISSSLIQLDKKEDQIRKQYERFLQGNGLNEISTSSRENKESLGTDAGGTASHESFISRRDNFLESLNHKFRELDEDLSTIEEHRKEFNNANEEISRKKADALATTGVLRDKEIKLQEEIGQIKNEIQATHEEERALIQEFEKILKEVETSMDLKNNIDGVLISSLSSVESPDNSLQPCNSDNGGQ